MIENAYIFFFLFAHWIRHGLLKGVETANRDFSPSSGVAAIKKEISISKQKWTRREILGAGATAVAAP